MNAYYRKVYLQSEDWKSIRKLKLLKSKCKCALCGKRSPHNDIHHVLYKELYFEDLRELRVLCRKCHDFVHKIMKLYPEISSKDPKRKWQALKNKMVLDSRSRITYELKQSKVKPYNEHPLFLRATALFRRARRWMLTVGKIKTNAELHWDDRLVDWYIENRPNVSPDLWFKARKSLEGSTEKMKFKGFES